MSLSLKAENNKKEMEGWAEYKPENYGGELFSDGDNYYLKSIAKINEIKPNTFIYTIKEFENYFLLTVNVSVIEKHTNKISKRTFCCKLPRDIYPLKTITEITENQILMTFPKNKKNTFNYKEELSEDDKNIYAKIWIDNIKPNISLIILKLGDFIKNLFVKKEVVINSGNNLSKLMLINQRLYQKVLLLDSLIEKKFFTGSTIKEKIKKEVSELIAKYILFYENSRFNTSLINEDIGEKIEAAINSLIERFNDVKHEFEIDSHIREIDNLIEVYEKI